MNRNVNITGIRMVDRAEDRRMALQRTNLQMFSATTMPLEENRPKPGSDAPDTRTYVAPLS